MLTHLVAPRTCGRDWETFLETMRAGPFRVGARFTGGGPAPLPTSAAAAFEAFESSPVYLTIECGSVVAHCHFFEPSAEVRLDIDPREVTDASRLESVLALMRHVAAALGRPVRATPESYGPREDFERYDFLEVSPDGEAAMLRTDL
ncbi:MAG TPA: hypothetical protein VF796_03220 [Humisphaera sp.]